MITDSGVLSESLYWIDYTGNPPDQVYYENAFNIVLSRKGWTEDNFIKAVNKQLMERSNKIYPEFIDIIDIVCDACSLASISMPYIGDYVFTSPRSSSKDKCEPENVESFQDAGLFNGGDCVAEYEEIYTRDGVKAIKDVHIGDEVLSYDFTKEFFKYKKVTNKWKKGILPIHRVTFINGTHIDVTNNHPMWSRINEKGKSIYKKTPLSKIPNTWFNKRTPITNHIHYEVIDIPWLTEDMCYIIGHFFGLDTMSQTRYINATCANCTEELIPRLKRSNIPYVRLNDTNGMNVIKLDESPLKFFINSMIRTSFDLKLSKELLSLPKQKLQAILDGLSCGSSHYNLLPKENKCFYSTNSYEFALQIEEISIKLGNHMYIYNQSKTGISKPLFRLYGNGDESKREYGYHGLGETSIDKIEEIGSCLVYDIEVDDTHNFIFRNGVIGHNCEDLANLTYRIFNDLCNGNWGSSPLLQAAKKVGELFIPFGQAGSVTSRYLGEKKLRDLPVIGSEQDINAQIGYHMFCLFLPIHYVMQLIKFTNKTTGPDLEKQINQATHADNLHDWKRYLPSLTIEGTGFMEAFLLPVCDYYDNIDREMRCKLRKAELKALNTVLLKGSALSQCQYKLIQSRLSKTTERTRLSAFYRKCSHMWTDYFLKRGYSFMKFTWVRMDDEKWVYGVDLRDIIERNPKNLKSEIGILITPGFTEYEMKASLAILRQQIPLVTMHVQKDRVITSSGDDYTDKTYEYIEQFNKVKPSKKTENDKKLQICNLYIRPELFVDLTDLRNEIFVEIEGNPQIISAQAKVDFITDTISVIRLSLTVNPIREHIFGDRGEFTPQHNNTKLVSIFEACNRETGSIKHISHEFHHPIARNSFEAGALGKPSTKYMKKKFYDMGKRFRDETKAVISLSSRHVVKSSSIRCQNVIENQKIEALKEDFDNFVLVQWNTTDGKKYLNAYNFDNPLDSESFCAAIEGRVKIDILKKNYNSVYKKYKNAMKSRSSQVPTIIYSTSHSYRYTDFIN